jgi:outer membrane protein insertion porin family
MPIYNRMFLGGPKSIRGIRYRYVAPMAKREESNHRYAPWGGQTLACANLEYTIPIIKMLRFAVFSDVGSVGEDVFDLDIDDTFAWTAGVGFRLDIPMFPIRLDFATPIVEPDHTDKEVFSFSIGYDF